MLSEFRSIDLYLYYLSYIDHAKKIIGEAVPYYCIYHLFNKKKLIPTWIKLQEVELKVVKRSQKITDWCKILPLLCVWHYVINNLQEMINYLIVHYHNKPYTRQSSVHQCVSMALICVISDICNARSLATKSDLIHFVDIGMNDEDRKREYQLSSLKLVTSQSIVISLTSMDTMALTSLTLLPLAIILS